ncbi:MAG: TRAP transporter small permease subunit [Pseudomonadota bacterium]
MLRIHRAAVQIAYIFAVIGGVVLSLLILITCASILGRTLNSILYLDIVTATAPAVAQWLIDVGVGAIRGDFELVEAGMAFCIFAFLPLTQLSASHASVDVVVNLLPRGVRRSLILLAEILFAVVLVVIAIQLYDGMGRKLRSGETTLLLQFPVWWSYALSLIGAVAAAAAGVYMAIIRAFEVISGQSVVDAGSAEH